MTYQEGGLITQISIYNKTRTKGKWINSSNAVHNEKGKDPIALFNQCPGVVDAWDRGWVFRSTKV